MYVLVRYIFTERPVLAWNFHVPNFFSWLIGQNL
jgi:hypothetical protein